MNKKDKKAIKIFEALKWDRKHLSENNASSWKSNVLNTIKKYLGGDSDFYTHCKKISFFGIYSTTESDKTECLDRGYSRLIAIIEQCIDYIQRNGIYKPTNISRNFLGTISNAVLISSLIVIIPGFTAVLNVSIQHKTSLFRLI